MDFQQNLVGNSELKEKVFSVAQGYVGNGLHIVCVHSAFAENKIKRGKAPSHYNWQKEPLGWEQLKGEMERVWSREGGCNIGLKTGKTSGLVCVDIDAKGGGLAWFHENQEHLGHYITEHTHGGGLHLYFRYPRGVENLPTLSSGRRIFKGVDILADGHGQVVTWPSIHASQEMQYHFERGLDLIDALEESDELPKWIVDEMLKGERKEDSGKVEDRESEDALDIKAASLALKDLAPAVQGDGGDLQTLKAAMMCRDYGLSARQVYELLLREYNDRCVPPWSEKDLKDKVKNAFKYAKMSQGVRSISNAFDEPAEVPEAPAVRAGDQRYSKKNAVHSAKVFLSRMQGKIECYDGQFVIYMEEDHRWAVVADAYVESLIYRDIERVEGDGELLRTMKANHPSDIRKAVKLELNKAGVIPDVHWRGRSGKDYISLSNGVLDVPTGDLLPHSQDWFCFQSVDVQYDDNARCESFLKFLEDVWDGDVELIESLRLWMGYCLLSQANLQKFAVFKGASRAGKSTLVGVIEAMLGRANTASTSLSLIGSDFGLESLMGKKLCVFQDADRASMDRMGVATERIKSLASNDPVGINRKGQTVVHQRLGAKVAFVCNRMPPFLNDENALTNRMIVFPFWKSFQGKEDFGLLERLEGEVQGVLNWALVGARRLLRGERLVMSSKGQEALREINEQLDSVQGWVAECVSHTGQEHNKVSGKTMWDSYKEWCKDCGRMAKNKQKFFMELSSHPSLRDRKWRSGTDRGFSGIKLLTDLMGAIDEEVPF